MSKIEVNTVAPQCGTTLTLGESGDTVTLGSGATQSGFGRSGSVNWQTTIKTADFTAVSGEGYFCDTASVGAFTLTLPSSPSVGDIVALKDYASNFATANLTIGRGGSNLNGSALDSIRSTDNESLTIVYADATKGWIPVEEGTGFVGESFIAATGGNAIVTCGNFKTHVFTSPGSFCVSSISGTAANNKLDYLVVAGGGGGAGNRPACGPTAGAGGGGAGGFRTANSLSLPAPLTSPLANPSGLTATAASFPITVGAGGAGGTLNGPVPSAIGVNGSSSIFSSITSAGGGYGLYHNVPNTPGVTGGPGGSGGGSGRDVGSPGGTGNTPPVSPSQGNNGGSSQPAPFGGAGGGGGAGAVGANSSGGAPGSETGGPGGVGSFIDANFVGPTAPSYGTSGPVSNTRYFAGGGGGGVWENAPGLGTGGSGGGGAAARANGCGTGGTATSGTTNTGGGGGGGLSGGAGGSGIVIIRYKFQ
jgi:hypothetical protein